MPRPKHGRFKTKCSFCRNKFKCYRWEKKRKPIFCSLDCWYAFQRRENAKNGRYVTKICDGCDEKFTDYLWSKKKFCTVECYKENQYNRDSFKRKKFKCKFCGKYKLSLRKIIFCSKQCQGYYWSKFGLPKSVIKGRHLTPNKCEIKLKKIIRGLKFRYVGNLRKRIGGRYPDFINEKKKVIIELFGKYWHPKSDIKQRKYHYKKFGYKCIVIWDKDLRQPKKILRKIHKAIL